MVNVQKMVNQQNAGNILNFVFEKSKLFLLPTFVSFRKLLSRFWFRVVAMVFLQNFAREIGTRATSIYALAHARAFDRGEIGWNLHFNISGFGGRLYKVNIPSFHIRYDFIQFPACAVNLIFFQSRGLFGDLHIFRAKASGALWGQICWLCDFCESRGLLWLPLATNEKHLS